MNCEMCAKDFPKLRDYRVDGVKMMLCMDCGRFGTPIENPATAADPSRLSVGDKLEQRARRMGAGQDALGSGEKELAPDFGDRIKRGRERKGLDRQQLADKIHQPVPTVTKYEMGQLNPSDRAIKDLEKVLGITLMESVDVSDFATRAAQPAPSRGLTLGDLIKDAQKKQK